MLRRIAITTFVLPLLWSFPADAATVTAVKGQRVLVDLEGAESYPGDEFFLINPTTQKKTAIIRLRQVKAGKAIAEIVKGRGDKGFTLQAKGSSKMSAEVPPPTPEGATDSTADYSSPARDTGYLRVLKNSWGALGTFTMNTMDATITSAPDAFGYVTRGSANMKGNGFGVGGFYDYVFTSEVVGHISAMMEQFTATGSANTAVCNKSTSTSCDVSITSLSLYGVGKYYFSKDKYRFWGGGGMGFLIPMSKSSTALSKIETSQVLTFAFGADIQMDRKNYIPVSIEYNYFWPSADVTANQILLKAGWAWNL